MTRVVNLYKEHYDVYIGRPGKGQSGLFGNPVAIGRKCPICGKIHNTGAETLPCFRTYFYNRLSEDESFRRAVQGLKGKTLGCFCMPKPCHGQVIAEYLDGENHDC